MPNLRVKADRNATSLLDFMFWSDLIVILVIVGVNIANILRANSGQGALVTAAEPELVLIVSRTAQKNRIMKAIMDGADRRAGAIVFSLPVTDTAGLRLLEEEEPTTK